MEIRISYQTEHRDKLFYGVCFEVFDEGNKPIPFSLQERLADEYNISADRLLSEEYFKEKNIAYYIEKETENIIPIGLIDFNFYYSERYIYICAEDKNQLYNLDRVINNIIQAIKDKYKAFELAEKFKNRTEDRIEI